MDTILINTVRLKYDTNATLIRWSLGFDLLLSIYETEKLGDLQMLTIILSQYVNNSLLINETALPPL